MNTNDIIIRLEKKVEYREVEKLVRESFWNVYNPGYKRGRRFSSLIFQRLYASDFFESHVLRQRA